MHICTECGRVGEEDSDFCYRCGSRKGSNIPKELIPPEFSVADTPRGKIVVRAGLKKAQLALLLGFVPGLFNVFGLGQFILGQYLRGTVFLACSAFYFYEKYVGYFGLEKNYLFAFTLAVFFIQMWGLFNALERAKFGKIN